MGRGSRPAARRRDRALHRDDVPAHPLHRGPGQGRAASWATRRWPSSPASAARSTGSSTSAAFMVAAARQRSARSTTGCRSTSRTCCARPASSSATSTRTTSTPAPWPTIWALDEVVAEHARKVYAVFKKHGVKTVITIDPHTTNMLRSVYPKLLPGYDIEVKHLPRGAGREGPGAGVRARARRARSSSTTRACSPATRASSTSRASCWRPPASPSASRRTRARMTWCCGGPVESLYPEKAAANAEKRVEQLARRRARSRHHVPDVPRQPERRSRRRRSASTTSRTTCASIAFVA